jgi:predicted nucleic acid-binding protein
MTSSTPAVVVDASAFAAVLFQERDGVALARRWASSRVIAPRLLSFELANVTLVKGRKEPDRMSAFIEAFRIFLCSNVEFVEIAFVDILPLAQRRNLSAYDAAYAWVALSRGIELVTLDKRLLAAYEAERNAALASRR